MAYDERYYIGKVLTLLANGKVSITFLEKMIDRMFKWPKPKDTDQVIGTYIFCSCVLVEPLVENGTYNVLNENELDKMYQSYKTLYMC